MAAEYPGRELEDVIIQLKKVLGYVPVGTMDLLMCLVHPDVIDKTQALLNSQNTN